MPTNPARPIQVGDRVRCFDAYSWNGRDRGDNSQFFRLATVIAVRAGWGDTDTLYDVRFDHRSDRISHGHYPIAIRAASSVERVEEE